ncbi:restriction endonuclease subunit S [Alloprevotella tannerae]
MPKGWAYCTLENVCNIHDNKRKAINATERAQRTKGKDISKLFPYFGATGQAGYIDEYLIDGRYILLGEDGAPFLDIFAIKAYEVNGKCWVNNHAHILEPLCDFEYIKFVLNGVDYSDYVNGSTRLKLTQTDMRVLKIPLPPIEEQKRIVVAIAKLFNMLDAIKENL